jgi:hypothetical protein
MELYSKRKKALENPPTAFRYDLPKEFRNQVWHIWNDAIGSVQLAPLPSPLYRGLNLSGSLRSDRICALYAQINMALCDEYGIVDLPGSSPCDALFQWFLAADTDTALDIIQVSFLGIAAGQNRQEFMVQVQPRLSAVDAVAKLNQRFQEHAIGYRLEQPRIIRIDSEFLHAEAVEPALHSMFANGYEGALAEFQLALQYYRQGADHYDDCLTNCLKALESTLQKIIELRKWEMPGKAKFDGLFAEVKKKGLFPTFLGSHLDELKKLLQTVAVIRNEESGHGSGAVPNEVPDHLVAYQIHLTGSAIVFLIRCNEDYDKKKS